MTFQLTNDQPQRRAAFKDEPARQSVLFSGMNCLAGQNDLFNTDGKARECRNCGAPNPTDHRFFCYECQQTEAAELKALENVT